MANENNLKPARSKSEARERGKKGGQASGKSRRKRKAIKETLERLLVADVPENLLQQLRAAGLPEDDDTFQAAMSFSQLVQATKGDTRAAAWITDMVGERVQNINITQQIDQSSKELEAYLNGSDEQEKEDT